MKLFIIWLNKCSTWGTTSSTIWDFQLGSPNRLQERMWCQITQHGGCSLNTVPACVSVCFKVDLLEWRERKNNKSIAAIDVIVCKKGGLELKLSWKIISCKCNFLVLILFFYVLNKCSVLILALALWSILFWQITLLFFFSVLLFSSFLFLSSCSAKRKTLINQLYATFTAPNNRQN